MRAFTRLSIFNNIGVGGKIHLPYTYAKIQRFNLIGSRSGSLFILYATYVADIRCKGRHYSAGLLFTDVQKQITPKRYNFDDLDQLSLCLIIMKARCQKMNAAAQPCITALCIILCYAGFLITKRMQ